MPAHSWSNTLTSRQNKSAHERSASIRQELLGAPVVLKKCASGRNGPRNQFSAVYEVVVSILRGEACMRQVDRISRESTFFVGRRSIPALRPVFAVFSPRPAQKRKSHYATPADSERLSPNRPTKHKSYRRRIRTKRRFLPPIATFTCISEGGFGRNRGSRSGEAVGRRNEPEAVP